MFNALNILCKGITMCVAPFMDDFGTLVFPYKMEYQTYMARYFHVKNWPAA